MKQDKLQIVTNIERLPKDKVHVVVTCNNETLDDFIVDTKSTIDIMMKAKDCIAVCTKKLLKYK